MEDCLTEPHVTSVLMRLRVRRLGALPATVLRVRDQRVRLEIQRNLLVARAQAIGLIELGYHVEGIARTGSRTFEVKYHPTPQTAAGAARSA